MTFDSIRRDEGGVSPVVGVILLVGITIVLASTIAVFVLNTPENIDDETSASFSVDYQENSNACPGTQNELTLVKQQGDLLEAENVYLVGSGLGSNTGESWSVAGGAVDPSNSRIVAGNSLKICGVQPDFKLRLTYDAGDSTTTLQEEQGPAA